MGDWDYGRKHGLWGNDGIPYGIDRDYNTSSRRRSKSKVNYRESERLALQFGFKKVYSDYGYNGKYFIKNGKKWIHDIVALKKHLGLSSNIELKRKGYDVDTYYASH